MVTLFVLIGLFLLVAALGVASALGATTDTRDPAYSAGRLLYPTDSRS